jgi:carboxyl-terminal processing protease
MGTQTFGKGSVQTILPLGNNTAIKLTTARYYTPAGRSIQAKGITPDIVVEDPATAAKEAENRVREADLARHLLNDKNKDEPAQAIPAKPMPPANAPQPNGTPPSETAPLDPAEVVSKNDFQVNQAVNLLKGLQIVNTRN